MSCSWLLRRLVCQKFHKKAGKYTSNAPIGALVCLFDLFLIIIIVFVVVEDWTKKVCHRPGVFLDKFPTIYLTLDSDSVLVVIEIMFYV